ncbi:MAG: glycosyltransferase family 4 protein [Anaerolineae bacterium]|nr:glycosyltransferase family 4 protein [Anaerolineae bacterium]
MTTLKVCIFTETYYPVIGGGETQARLLADGLAAQGFPVIILTRRSDASLAKVERFGAITVYRLPPVGRGQLKKWGLMFSSVPRLIQLRHQYDLIFVSGFRIVGVTAVLLGKLLGKSVVLKADSQGEMSGEFFTAGLAKLRLSPSSFLFRLFVRGRNAVLKRADAFAAITAETAVEMTDAGIPPSAIHMIPNSVDTDRFFPVDAPQKMALRQKLGLPPDGKYVIYTGRLVSYKGLPLLLNVWPEIVRQHPDARLLLVGTGGLDIHNCEAELKAAAHANGLQDSIIFTGSVQNVPDYLQASDIFVLPTEDDAFPSSLIEAMTCRLAVVSTPVGAIKIILTDGQNGLLVPPGDFEQLFRAVDSLLTDADLAARLGQAGWQTVQNCYAAEIVNRQYIRLFWAVARPFQTFSTLQT